MTNENVTELKQWPMDFDALQKGDVISVADVEQMTGKRRGTDEYRFALMNLKDMICGYLESKERMWTVSTEGDRINILTDTEAVKYTESWYESGRKRMRRMHSLAMGVDTAQLTTTLRDAHYRNIQVHGFEISAMKKSRAEALKAARKEAQQ